ncbi:MAG: alpha/beta hydrolase [Pirellulales bacterium]
MRKRAALVCGCFVLLAPVVLSADDTGGFQANADLPPLLEFRSGRIVQTRADWSLRKKQIADLLQQYFIGSFPETVPALRSAKILGERRAADGSLRRRVLLTFDTPSKASFEIRVWIPKGEGPHPILLTQPRYYQLRWAEMALERGYIACLYPGVDSHHREKEFPRYESVWQDFRREYPEATWSEISTKAWLASRTLDYLLAPASGYRLAAGKVGIIGFSRYGKQSLIAAAFDERITSVVARSPGSPGSCPYRFTSRNTCAEAPQDFPSEWFRPSLRGYTGREHELPIDAHGWYALIAPRRCMIHTAYNDGSEPTFAVERGYLEGRSVYSFLGHPGNLRVLYRSGQHGPVTEEQRRRNMDWFDLSFGRGTAKQEDFPEELIHHFDWAAWKKAASAEGLRPPFSSPEAASDADRRARIRWLLGEPPKRLFGEDRRGFISREESEMMTHDRWRVGGTSRTPVRFGAGVRGNIYFKTKAVEPAPAVIWLHPYSYHSGYNEGYGVEGTTVYHRLAAAGYVVLAYDQCGFGLRLLEGRDFYSRAPRWSRLGRMVADVSAAADFLIEGEGDSQGVLPPVDKDRVYVLGFSVGAMAGLYATALDERIAGVASFGGFTPMRSDTSVATGGLKRLWQWHSLVPRLGLFDGAEEQIPFDYHDVLALIAPRPCLVYAARRDRELDPRAVSECIRRAQQAWSDRGAADGIEYRSPDDIGRFQKAQQEMFLSWLRSQD